MRTSAPTTTPCDMDWKTSSYVFTESTNSLHYVLVGTLQRLIRLLSWPMAPPHRFGQTAATIDSGVHPLAPGRLRTRHLPASTDEAGAAFILKPSAFFFYGQPQFAEAAKRDSLPMFACPTSMGSEVLSGHLPLPCYRTQNRSNRK